MSKPVVLAFSGGLDTSFCVPYLRETLSARVITLTVNCGGLGATELEQIATRARELGAEQHVTIDGRQTLFDKVLRFLIAGNVMKGGTYPLCVGAERIVQAQALVDQALCEQAATVAHGCTGAGNDQIRFEVALRALAPHLEVLAPIRDLGLKRTDETAFLRERGYCVPEKTTRYSINRGLWGVTIGGVETHSSEQSLPEEAWLLTAGARERTPQPQEIELWFERGVPVGYQDGPHDPVGTIEALNDLAGRYGIGRGIHLGDTIIGIKGRVGFEAPAATVLLQAHRELEKLCLTKWQLFWKDQIADFYGTGIHEGMYFDPVMRDIEALLEKSQERVTGSVRVRLQGGSAFVLGVKSPYSMFAVSPSRYGEELSGGITARDVAGFSRVMSNQSVLAKLAGESLRFAQGSAPALMKPSAQNGRLHPDRCLVPDVEPTSTEGTVTSDLPTGGEGTVTSAPGITSGLSDLPTGGEGTVTSAPGITNIVRGGGALVTVPWFATGFLASRSYSSGARRNGNGKGVDYQKTRAVTLDKIASVTRNVLATREVRLSCEIAAQEGAVVAGRVLNFKTTYNELEDAHGRMARVHPGDIIAGALGHRDALHGYSGHVPASLKPGDRIHLLNLGGVLGQLDSGHPDLGAPFEIEVLGAVLSFPVLEHRVGVPAFIQDGVLHQSVSTLADVALPPVIAIVGTSMNSGKTEACCEVIRGLANRGLKVAAGKCTGVSLYKDVLRMVDHGASAIATFTDMGVVTTSDATAPRVTRSLLKYLAQSSPDVIVLELGDGLMGSYGVAAILAAEDLRRTFRLSVVCAHDPVGAWGAVRLLHESYGLTPSLVTGPITDHDVGVRFVKDRLAIEALNARRHGAQVAAFIAGELAAPIASAPRDLEAASHVS